MMSCSKREIGASLGSESMRSDKAPRAHHSLGHYALQLDLRDVSLREGACREPK